MKRRFPVVRRVSVPNAQVAMKNAVKENVRIAKKGKPAARKVNAPAVVIAARSLKPNKSGL